MTRALPKLPWALLAAVCLALAAAACLLLAAGGARGEDRFAVVIGNDAGEGGEVQLRYAETDAARVASVLQEVGGVRPENLVLLRGQDAGTVRRTLIAVNDRVRAAGGQGAVVPPGCEGSQWSFVKR